MDQKVAQAAQDLADALKADVASSAKLRGAQEDEAQKALAAEFKDFESAVKARREKMAGQFQDADDDVATIDNPTDKYLRFGVEGDDYILQPGSNKIVSYSIGIPASRVAAIASGQLFAPHGVVFTIVKGKRTLATEALMEEMAATSKLESEERAALEGRLKAERSVKEALTANVMQRITSNAAAEIARTTMPAPAPVRSSEMKKGATPPPGTPVVKDTKGTKESKAEEKRRTKEEKARKIKEEKERKKAERAAKRKK